MKVIVIGGSGLIGKQLVTVLQQQGHDVIAASRSTGINSVTGTGLVAAVSGREVVIDVSNAPSFEDQAVMEFFTASSTNALAAAKRAGVKHYIALSVVGTERLQASGYREAGSDQNLLAALRQWQPPAGRGFVWAAGEYSSMQAVREILLQQHALDKRYLRVASYWKRGVQNAHEKIEG